MSRLRHLLFCALAAGLALAPASSQALSYVMLRDDALVARADGAGVFEVVAVAASPGREETRYTLARVRALYGAAMGKTETLVLPGFVTDDARLVVDGIPMLSPGQQLLLLHKRRADGDLQAADLTLGMFFPVKLGGHEAYARYLDEAASFGGSRNAGYAQLRDAAAFERWIARQGHGQPAAADYFVDAPESMAKFQLVQLNFGNPMYPIGPGRWRIFEDGMPIRWFAPAGGQQGPMVEDEFAMLQAGMMGWVDEPGSLILMTYNGTSVPDPVPADAATVRWNDPQNQIPNDYDCGPNGGGTIGLGGSSASSNRHTYNGNLYYPLSRGFVATTPTSGCIMDDDDGRTGIEFFTHEIGHVLGYAHSCSGNACASDPVANDATMRAFIHGDGRGATLAADDVAAARFLYEDPDVAPPAADLSLDLAVTPPNAERGDTLTYTATVANAGPDAATGVTVQFNLPAGVTFDTGITGGWTCNAAGAGAACTRAAPLDNGASSAVAIQADIPIDYAGPSTLNANANADSAVEDPVTGNNADSISSQVNLIADRIFGDSFE